MTVLRNFTILTVAAWPIYFLIGEKLSNVLSSRLGSLISNKTRGLVPDPSAFFNRAIFEGLLLFSVCLALSWLCLVLFRAPQDKVNPYFRYICLAVVLFFSINIFFYAASFTTTYWLASYLAYPNLKQSFFYTNLNILSNSTATKRVAIVGSSQGQSQFDAGLLNRAFYPNAQFANLSYPGASGWDFNLLYHRYQPLNLDTVLLYISVMNFYDKNPGSSRIIPLINTASINDVLKYKDDGFIDTQDRLHGLLSWGLPLFQQRRNIELSLLGPLAEKGFAISRTVKAPRPAHKRTYYWDRFEVSATSEYQKEAFRAFLDRNLSTEMKVILIIGQVNPSLHQNLPDGVSEDFREYVAEIRDAYGEKIQIIDDEIPDHQENAYDDFMHINDIERDIFTDAVINLTREHFN